MVHYERSVYPYSAKVDWTLHALVDFKVKPAPWGHSLVASSKEADPDEDYETELEIRLDDNLIHLRLFGPWNDQDFNGINRECRSINLSLAYYFQGNFETFTLIGEPGKMHLTFKRKSTPSRSWKFDPSSPEIRKLLAAIAHGGTLVHLAISGFQLGVAEGSARQRWPIVAVPSRPLLSVAALMKSTDSDFVLLVPTLPSGEHRVLRAHRSILCTASSYFAALLESCWAEASALRQVQNQGNTPSSSRNQQEAKMEQGSQQPVGDPSQVPVLKVGDITYEQLETVLFFIYTGEAVFENIPCDYDAIDEDRKGDHDDRYFCPSYFLEQKTKTTDVIKNSLSWWEGHLEPTNAFDIYRIADKYCMQDLRSAALRHIAKDVSRWRMRTDLEEREEITIFPEIKDVYRNFCDIWFDYLEDGLDELLHEKLGMDVEERRSR